MAADTFKSSVSIIVPCRNEKRFIEPFIQSVLAQDLEGLEVEILIADGMSDDGTREILFQLQRQHPFIRTINNPEKIVSTGLNRLVQEAKGEVIVRMDVHTRYAQDYVKQCVLVLYEKKVANVGGAWRAEGKNYLQQAIALAFQSRFSSGGARSHSETYEGEVDSVYLGCWKKETLLKIGLFDETLVRNQDDELNLRLVRAGEKIWQSQRIRSWYSPRPSLKALLRQYAQYGYWKVRVIKKHRIPASVRHLIPGLFVATVATLGILSAFTPMAQLMLNFVLLSYFCALLFAALLTCCSRTTWRFFPVMPFVFGAYHLGYGYGFIRGLLDFLFLKIEASPKFQQVTR